MESVHVDPAQAVQTFVDLQARHFIPIHWGTFDLADEPLQEPPTLLRQAGRRTKRRRPRPPARHRWDLLFAQ